MQLVIKAVTILEKGDCSVLIKNNLEGIKYVYIDNIPSAEIVGTDEGSVIYFKRNIDRLKVGESYDMTYLKKTSSDTFSLGFTVQDFCKSYMLIPNLE